MGVRIIFSVVLLGFIVVAIFFYLSMLEDKNYDLQRVLYDGNEQLTGTIYLSGSLSNTSGTSIYEADVTTGSLEQKKYVGSEVEYNIQHIPQKNALTLASYDGASTASIIYQVGNDTQVVDFPARYKRNPKISPDGKKIAFAATVADYVDSDGFDPQKWNIVVYDIASEDFDIVANGMMPMWGPESRYLLFFNENGVNLFDETKSSIKSVIGINGEYGGQIKVNVSNSGWRLAWTTPSTGELILYDISSYDPFSAVISKRVSVSSDTDLYWPVFSPGDRYIAVQAADGERNDLSNQRLLVYDVVDDAFSEIRSLKEFDFLRLFTDDWQHN